MFLFIGILAIAGLGCRQYNYVATQVYEDHVVPENFPIYVNDSLDFMITFNMCHDIQTVGFSSKGAEIPLFISKQIRRSVRLPAEVLFYSPYCIVDGNSTQLMGIVYPRIGSLDKFTQQRLRDIRRSGRMDSLFFTYNYAVKSRFLKGTHKYFGSSGSPILRNTAVNRVSYLSIYQKRRLRVEEYHFVYHDHFLRFICVADVENLLKTFRYNISWQDGLQMNLENNLFNFQDSAQIRRIPFRVQ